MAVLNFGQFWVLTHLLPPKTLGGYTLLMGLMTMLHAMPLLGLHVPLMRRVAAEPLARVHEISNALVVAIPLSWIVALGVWLYGNMHFESALHGALLALVACIIPGAWILVAESALLGMERMDLLTKAQAIESLGRLVLGGAVVLAGGGLDGVMWVVMLLRWALALFYLVSPQVPKPQIAQVRQVTLRRGLSEIPTFFGIIVLAALVTRVDLIILERTRTLTEVGIYSAAVRLYEAALMLPSLAGQSLMPMLARMQAQDADDFKRQFARVLTQLMAFGGLFAVALACMAHLIVFLLYPDHLHAAGTTFAWLAVGTVMVMVDIMLSSAMQAQQAQTQDLRSTFFAAMVLVVALWVFTMHWGGVGAAWAVLLAHVVRLSIRIHWAIGALSFHNLPWLALRNLLVVMGCVVVILLAHKEYPAYAKWLAWIPVLTMWFVLARLLRVIDAQWLQGLRDLLRLRRGTPGG